MQSRHCLGLLTFNPGDTAHNGLSLCKAVSLLTREVCKHRWDAHVGPAEELQWAVAGTLGPCALAGAHGPIQAFTAAAFSVPGAERHLHILSKHSVDETHLYTPPSAALPRACSPWPKGGTAVYPGYHIPCILIQCNFSSASLLAHETFRNSIKDGKCLFFKPNSCLLLYDSLKEYDHFFCSQARRDFFCLFVCLTL